MALLKIAKLGNPILRQIAEEVAPKECQTHSFQQFLENMVETMRKRDGVGLAAPQVFISKRVIVVEAEDNPRYPESPTLPLLVIINPVLTNYSEETVESWEGCLSVDNLRGKVKRSACVHLSGYDRFMEKPIEIEAKGFLSVVFQHEVDHLNGLLYIDRINDLKMLSQLEEYDRYWSNAETANDAEAAVGLKTTH